jgi:hypothetical protein
MAAARKVKGLRCGRPLPEAARAVLTVRLHEVQELRSTISGPADTEALHDLRIACKRLRYSLETFAVCFPEGEAQSYADRVRAMQDILGRIHDLDVLRDLLVERVISIDEDARRRGLEIADAPVADGGRWQPLIEIVRNIHDADARLGLFTVIGAKGDERREQYGQFDALWLEWERNGFLEAIGAMIEHAGEGATA